MKGTSHSHLSPAALSPHLKRATLLPTDNFTFTGKVVTILCDLFPPLSHLLLKYLQNIPQSLRSVLLLHRDSHSHLLSSPTAPTLSVVPLSLLPQPFLHPSRHWLLVLCPQMAWSPCAKSVFPAGLWLNDSRATTEHYEAVLEAGESKRTGVTFHSQGAQIPGWDTYNEERDKLQAKSKYGMM